MTPRGIRLNNPGNIRLNPANHWQGQILPGSDPDFCQFDTMISGVRALAMILITYQVVHKLFTMRDIIGHWAPAGENDTNAYVADCCDHTGFDPDQNVALTHDSNLLAVVEAICEHENGLPATDIPYMQLAQGVEEALVAKGF